MGESVKVATLSEVPAGTARSLEIKGNAIALYNVDGALYATANTCAHRGGPLGEGDLDRTTITCPWHGFQYDVTSGKCLTNPALGVACYKVQVRGQDVLVEI
jgi:nitrite reductase/ring-hydroxylating ferredoxin subunit